MSLDEAFDQIGAVRRAITNRDHEGRPARVLTAEQTYPTGVDDVWDALTNPERIPRWFLPIEGDLKVGGHYQLVGNAGGVVERCEPPNTLAVTWEYGGEVTWLEVALTERDGDTTLVLSHIAHVDDQRWAEYGPGAVGVGWDLSLMSLAAHLASGDPVDQEAVAAWSAGEEGRGFMTRSSTEWADASVAAGTDPAEASAAAERTTAAYTGQPAPEA